MAPPGAWSRRGPVACLLWPLSLVYRGLASAHRAVYATGLRRRERVPAPVIVVGNVIAGGAGKTPVVLALLAHLRARGIAAGVVSRGYGRRTHDCREVMPSDDARDVGDEPLLLRRRAGCPVFVAARRADAARALLRAHPEVRVLLSDDGLQHHRLARDIEIVVFDERGAGNGWLLPAGPLREPWPRAADLVLVHGDAPGIAGHRMTRRLADEAVRADGTRSALAALPAPVHAVAGIAQPQRFFAMLEAQGVALAGRTALPDHFAFDDGAMPAPAGATLVCTEKDAVKLWRFAPHAWAVALEVELPPAFVRAFDALVDAKLSSPHGPQTA